MDSYDSDLRGHPLHYKQQVQHDMMMGRARGYVIDYGTFTPFDVPGSNLTNAWDIDPMAR